MALIDEPSTAAPRDLMPPMSPTSADVGAQNLSTNWMSSSPLIDVTTIDKKLQAMSSVEKSWSLPPLPDHVKLDLAMKSDQDHNGLVDFLHGLAEDVNRAINPFSAQPAAAAPLQSTQGLTTLPLDPNAASPAITDPDPNSVGNTVRRLFNSQAGLRAPQVADDNSVQNFKLRAISHGILPADTSIDGKWSPELNSAYYDML